MCKQSVWGRTAAPVQAWFSDKHERNGRGILTAELYMRWVKPPLGSRIQSDTHSCDQADDVGWEHVLLVWQVSSSSGPEPALAASTRPSCPPRRHIAQTFPPSRARISQTPSWSYSPPPRPSAAMWTAAAGGSVRRAASPQPPHSEITATQPSWAGSVKFCSEPLVAGPG